jgi:hypothetical protein
MVAKKIKSVSEVSAAAELDVVQNLQPMSLQSQQRYTKR